MAAVATAPARRAELGGRGERASKGTKAASGRAAGRGLGVWGGGLFF